LQQVRGGRGTDGGHDSLFKGFTAEQTLHGSYQSTALNKEDSKHRKGRGCPSRKLSYSRNLDHKLRVIPYFNSRSRLRPLAHITSLQQGN